MVATVNNLSEPLPRKISFSTCMPAAPDAIEAGELARRQVERMIRDLYGKAVDDGAYESSTPAVRPGQFGSIVRGGSDDDVVLVRDIPFTTCEHHLLPCVGKAHVAYLAGGRAVSTAQLSRTVNAVAARVQARQPFANQLADAVALNLTADAVAVVVELDHVCIEWSDPGAACDDDDAPATALRGRFMAEPALGDEVVALLGAPANA